jgi:hypothetical protein
VEEGSGVVGIDVIHGRKRNIDQIGGAGCPNLFDVMLQASTGAVSAYQFFDSPVLVGE